jgi:hypothetical protein
VGDHFRNDLIHILCDHADFVSVDSAPSGRGFQGIGVYRPCLFVGVSIQRDRIVNETLQELGVEQHPDKTFVGRIERGFTFLGYWITEKGVTGVAPSAWEAFQERVARLYEQNAPQEEILRRMEQYVRR